MKRLKFNLHSLRIQLLLSFIGLVLLTAAAIGVPALWLMRDQLERQAWAQVEQGGRAVQALYPAQQSELNNLALLTAQRPTLQQFLGQGQDGPFAAYLRTLQQGANLDLILICDPYNQVIVQVGQNFPVTTCLIDEAAGFYLVPGQSPPQVWLLAAQAIEQTGANLGRVIVGLRLSNEFAVQMQAQTGLEHILLVGGRPIAASFADTLAALPQLGRQSSPGRGSRLTFELDGQPYYATRMEIADLLPLPGAPTPGESHLEAELALAVTNIVATEQSLARTLIASILIVAAVGSILGAFLARQISRPLARLTKAATRLSQGDLTTPVPTTLDIQEVASLAFALEAARLDLQLTLNDVRREKAWSNHLLESIVEGIITLDSYGRITFFSQGAERITGWSRDKVIGRQGDEVLRPTNTDQPFSQLLPPQGRRANIVVSLPDGRQATLSVTGAKLSLEGQPVQTAVVFRDVSEEEVMHRLVGHFLANIAHEFRTPLSALAASAELLLDQAPDLTPPELQELLTSLHLGVLGLQTLIDNLLESASIEAGRFHVSPGPSHLAQIIAEVSHTMQPLLAKRSQALLVEMPGALPLVQADSRRTTQVLINLLSNASKFSPDKTEIIVGVVTEEDWVRVSVADQGPGIPPEFRTDLFRLFMHDRGSSDDRLVRGGTGLGLSVVKAVVEAQGGQVGVNNRPGGGAIFWFTLPMVAAP